MKKLIDVIKEAEKNKIAIGHFNISDLAAFKGILQAARALNVPVIIGVSEGERQFIGVKTIAFLVQSYRKEFDYPVYLNADHTKTMEGVKEAVDAGFDSIIFDRSHLPFRENMEQTKQAVKYIKSKNSKILVEGELGYIGSSSQMLDKIPEGAAVQGNLTDPQEAKEFVKETKVDALAPAVGNIHGMLKNAPEPSLDIERIKNIKAEVGVPLVLHGASGNSDSDLTNVIQAGISLVHINTEIRKAWRESLEKSFQEHPDEVAPYKLLDPVVLQIQNLVTQKLRLLTGSR